MDLSSILEPGRAAKTDKLVILADAIRELHQLRSEAEEYKEENKKLKEEIESLKVGLIMISFITCLLSFKVVSSSREKICLMFMIALF